MSEKSMQKLTTTYKFRIKTSRRSLENWLLRAKALEIEKLKFFLKNY